MKIDRLFVVSLGAITGLASCSSGQEEEAQRPNILILLADDAGYADFGFMGATDIQTPNIDRLAAEGCIFTDAHVAATVSSPSRSMMLTGRYGQRYGYECNLDKPGDGLPDDEELLPALLKRYDYRTGCIGNGIWAPNPPSVRMRKASIRSTGFWPAIVLISMILKPVIRMATCNNTSTTGGNCLSTVTSPMNWLLRHSSLLRRASSPLCCICPLPLPILPMKRRKRIWRVSKDSPARSMRL